MVTEDEVIVPEEAVPCAALGQVKAAIVLFCDMLDVEQVMLVISSVTSGRSWDEQGPRKIAEDQL